MLYEGNNAIALFDILGFRDLVRQKASSELPKLLDDLQAMTEHSRPSSDLVGTAFFSDTILLYGTSREQSTDVAMVIVAASNLLGLAAQRGIPLRGALSFGHMFIDSTKGQIIGPPLVCAYEIEQQQEWMGAVIDPKQTNIFEEAVKDGPVRCCIVPYPAPMKSGARIVHLCIDWMFRISGRAVLKDVFRNAEQRHDIYRKYMNTLEFADCRMPKERHI